MVGRGEAELVEVGSVIWSRSVSKRETGLEPATFYLGSRRSTTELLPRECCNGYWC